METINCFTASGGFSRIGTDAPIVRSIEIDTEPEEVIICAGFGFIIVCGRDKMIVFIMNGSKICAARFEGGFVGWAPFVNERGFDFVIVLDEQKTLAVVEVFNLKMAKRVWVSSERVGVFAYDDARRGIVVATHGGCAYFVPYLANETGPVLDR
jgi:hypothetical protein